MKRKVGELYDKPIVIGNKNKVEKHEIHIDDLVSEGEGTEVDIDDIISMSLWYDDLGAVNLTKGEVFEGRDDKLYVEADEPEYDGVFSIRNVFSTGGVGEIWSNIPLKITHKYLGEDIQSIKLEFRLYKTSFLTEMPHYYNSDYNSKNPIGEDTYMHIESPTGRKYKIYLIRTE